MKKYAIRFRPAARTDLFDLYKFILKESGYKLAAAYIDRIKRPAQAWRSSPGAAGSAMIFIPVHEASRLSAGYSSFTG